MQRNKKYFEFLMQIVRGIQESYANAYSTVTNSLNKIINNISVDKAKRKRGYFKSLWRIVRCS